MKTKLIEIITFAKKKGYYDNGFLSVPLVKVEKELEENKKNIKLYYTIKNDNRRLIEINILKEKIVW